MDDFVEGVVGVLLCTGIGIALVLGIAGVIAAGWLIYKFCEYILVPFLEWLFEACAEGGRQLAAWWHEVTWERRMIQAHDEAVREIDAVRREHVAQTYALVEVLEEMEQVRTADETAAVRVAVRSAVRQD